MHNFKVFKYTTVLEKYQNLIYQFLFLIDTNMFSKYSYILCVEPSLRLP